MPMPYLTKWMSDSNLAIPTTNKRQALRFGFSGLVKIEKWIYYGVPFSAELFTKIRYFLLAVATFMPGPIP